MSYVMLTHRTVKLLLNIQAEKPNLKVSLCNREFIFWFERISMVKKRPSTTGPFFLLRRASF